MPFLGLGLHVLVALFFAIHVVRSRQEIYWLFILFMFPLLGSVVYFLAVYLPASRLPGGIKKASSAAGKVFDPGRALREARHDFELTPTVHNRLLLAGALTNMGELEEAAEHFETCLTGPFASDPEVCLGAARARLRLRLGRNGAARDLLLSIKKDHPNYQSEHVELLIAQSFARDGRNEEAEKTFRAAVSRFDSVEARAEYAIFALDAGDLQTASYLCNDIDQAARYWSAHSHKRYKPLMKRLDAALASAHKS